MCLLSRGRRRDAYWIKVAAGVNRFICGADIAGMVAALTEDELGVASERTCHNTLSSAMAFAKADGWPGSAFAGDEHRSEVGMASCRAVVKRRLVGGSV